MDESTSDLTQMRMLTIYLYYRNRDILGNACFLYILFSEKISPARNQMDKEKAVYPCWFLILPVVPKFIPPGTMKALEPPLMERVS